MINAFETGIADYLYPKYDKYRKCINNRPPAWMDDDERKEWDKGFSYANSLMV